MQKGNNIIRMCFPEGKTKAVTLSYDDGVEQDVRLLEIMKKYGLKGTFNLNSGCYAPEDTIYSGGELHRRMTREQCIALFKDSGMEVAVHGFSHRRLTNLSTEECKEDVWKDRFIHEKDYETIVRGMAYPIGSYNDDVVSCLEECGILYARTVISSERFDVPNDWLRLEATCHHNNPRLMELAREFVQEKEENVAIFYLWGHSYEFEKNNNWNVIEEFASFIGGRNDIWYATNMEICEYVKAYEQLVFSLDRTMVYNPTEKSLYFIKNEMNFQVEPGKIIHL